MQKKIILFELNEVPFRVFDTFCEQHPESAFARVRADCSEYETVSEDRIPLSPWRTWPSLHRGVNDQLHGIHDFGQDLQEVDRSFPPVWSILSSRKVRTGVCASLHSYPLPNKSDNYSFYLPDAFARTPECIPDSLSAFQEFNLTMSRASARNVSTKLLFTSALPVLMKAPALGVRLSTLLEIGAQLAGETRQRWRKTR